MTSTAIMSARLITALHDTGAMTHAPTLALGNPRFFEPDCASLAREGRTAEAWARAFLRHGVNAPAQVGGAFAVALQAADGQVWMACDRFGQQTLCYALEGGTLRFAERADALAPRGPDALDPQALFDYLYFHCIPSPRTVFRGVMRLEPGFCAHFDGRELHIRPFWTPTFDDPASARFDTARDEFRVLLQQAVARELEPNGKPACFLSGGTDSSTVAGMIGLATGRPAATYSIGFEAQGYDEMAFARVAARHFGTEHHEYYVTPADLVAGIGTVAQHYDQPFGNSSALPAFYCAKVARDDGVTRLLAGDGGDELFGGNARYAKQRVFGWYRAVPRPLQAGLLEPLLLRTPLGGLPLLKKGASYVEQARVPMPARLQQYNLLLRLGVQEVLTPGFRSRVDEGAPLAHQQRVWGLAQCRGELNRTLAYDWRYTLADSDLPKVRGTTQLAGVEVGFPMLDDALLAFSQRLPDAYKLKGLKLRWFFKEALRGFLPDEILTKKKQGFGLPFGVWATQHAGLRALAEDSLRSLAGRDIVRPDFIDALLKTHLPAHPGYYGEMVWILMMLEQWLRGRE
jgi:asparagine synthase (glutamine-hydrolysing)